MKSAQSPAGSVGLREAASVVFAFLPARAADTDAVAGPLDALASVTFAEAEGVLAVDEAGAA